MMDLTLRHVELLELIEKGARLFRVLEHAVGEENKVEMKNDSESVERHGGESEATEFLRQP